MESLMCPALYNDIAEVTFGLYENKDDHHPYELLVVSIEHDKLLTFTSEEFFKQNETTVSYGEWCKSYPDIQELSGRVALRYEPHITTCDSLDKATEYNSVYFENLFAKTQIDMMYCWPIYDGRIYVILYKDTILKEKGLPELMLSACESVLFVWREYFNVALFTTPPPRIDIKDIIESLDDFREMAPFFGTVTKISSLFYEKTRSNGSIAVIGNRNEQPLVQFKTDTTGLSFSFEHAKQLRKLLETTKNGLSLLIHDGIVYGIGDLPHINKRKCIFNITGHMEWNAENYHVEKDEVQRLRYKHGEYYLATAVEIREWYIQRKIGNSLVRKTVNHILQDEYHGAFEYGALLIITDSAEKEVERLCKLNRGLHTERVNMASQFEKASALCAIDGALFLDMDGDCHGIGVILDGEAITSGTPARGSRYNSTKTYVSRCVANNIEVYAVIISADGYLDILTSHDEEFKHISHKHEKVDL